MSDTNYIRVADFILPLFQPKNNTVVFNKFLLYSKCKACSNNISFQRENNHCGQAFSSAGYGDYIVHKTLRWQHVHVHCNAIFLLGTVLTVEMYCTSCMGNSLKNLVALV